MVPHSGCRVTLHVPATCSAQTTDKTKHPRTWKSSPWGHSPTAGPRAVGAPATAPCPPRVLIRVRWGTGCRRHPHATQASGRWVAVGGTTPTRGIGWGHGAARTDAMPTPRAHGPHCRGTLCPWWHARTSSEGRAWTGAEMGGPQSLPGGHWSPNSHLPLLGVL
jgi:hypothetical protein